jgi:hypothetical protein
MTDMGRKRPKAATVGFGGGSWAKLEEEYVDVGPAPIVGHSGGAVTPSNAYRPPRRMFRRRRGQPRKTERKARWRAVADSPEFRLKLGYADDDGTPLSDNACDRFLANELWERFEMDWPRDRWPERNGDLDPSCRQEAADVVRKALQIRWKEFR